MTVKARNVGNSIVLTVPNGIKVYQGAEYIVSQSSDGTITYQLKHRNPFEGDWFKEDIRQTDILGDSEVLADEWD
ncbi:type II toxin-antitoxin system PemI/MazE family antitoxin [Lapidilactobacillus achengensis]|uniref:Type II toxin-antitoxin system PemI/MazE family antitoxin n=1 Tax=Lapidilactobacillus achengensis TaxID=2486000 RepID=A0ABW1UMW8_9LACO|nr:AbrB/MazE/SpoVT family DNA-binding domain-containing protein [Lapidilactobacillus achengensis]